MSILINPENIKQNYKSIIGSDKVVLKFKASSTIGLGHLSRMITLATLLEEGATNVICAINNNRHVAGRLKKEGLRLIVNKFETDEEFIDLIIDTYKPDTIVIDGKYEYKSFDILRWKEGAKLIAIDFIPAFPSLL